jgi:hypothetical protein
MDEVVCWVNGTRIKRQDGSEGGGVSRKRRIGPRDGTNDVNAQLEVGTWKDWKTSTASDYGPGSLGCDFKFFKLTSSTD